MSDKSIARRTDIAVYFSGVDITSSVQKYLLSLTYTDNEEGETDDLQIKLQDRDGLWVEKWLNNAIQASAAGWRSVSQSSETTKYKVTAKSGAAVRSRAGDQYYQYGSLAYGTVIEVKSVSDGWANFMFSGKNAYVRASSLKAVSGSSSGSSKAAEKGMKIQATILRMNWRSDGKDEALDCGQFELDSVVAQGPPNTVTIKGTSLPYGSTVRQTLKSKSWEEYSLSGIANEIASKNGMTCMFSSAQNPSYTRVEQYRTSDIAFLNKLCQDAGCSLKVTNNIIVVFDQATYESKSPIMTISHGSGYTKYKLSTDEADTYTCCRVSYTTPSGKTITATAYTEDYDPQSDKNQRLEVRQRVSSTAEAMTLAEKMLRLHNKYELTASFTFPGDPALVAGCTVNLTGWGAWDGKYLIRQAKHKVDGSGYTTQIDLRHVLTAGNTVRVSATETEVESPKNEESSSAESFKVGDKVMVNNGVTTYVSGKTMASWVPSTVLYVRRIEQDGAVLLVSTSMDIDQYTGRIYASNMHKVG